MDKEQHDMFDIDSSQPIAIHLDDNVIADRRKWPKDLVEIADFIRAELDAAGIQDEERQLLIEKVLVAMCFRSGGRGFYLPQAHSIKTALLHKRIYDDYVANMPMKALIQKYRMSEQTLYGIIKEQRAIHLARIQPALFP